MSEESGTRRLLSAGALMASGTMISKVLGFVRFMLIAVVLGTASRQADIFSLAMTIPSAIYFLFAGGWLNTVLVPQIVRAIKNDDDGGEGYTNRILTLFGTTVLVVAALATVATPLLTRLYASSYLAPELSEHYESLLLVAYLCAPQIFFYGVFFIISQVLNAHEKFGPMMWAPILNNLISILMFVVYLLVWGQSGDRSAPFETPQALLLGIGSTIGIAAQAAIVIPFMRRTGFRFRPRFDFRHTGLGRTAQLAKWTVGFVIINQLTLMVISNLATSATATAVDGRGAGLTVYNAAHLLWILPHSLITVSLATAMLPQASRLADGGDLAGVRRETFRTLRLATTFLLPMAVAFIALAFPVTRVMFGHGQSSGDSGFIAWTLMAFSIGLVPFTMQYVALRTFFALEQTRATFLLQLLIGAVNVVAALALVLPFNAPSWVAPGLALAYSVAYFVGVTASFKALGRQLPDLTMAPIVRHLARVGLASVPAGVLAWAAVWAVTTYLGDGLGWQLLGLAAAGVVGVGTFLGVARVLHIREVGDIVRVVLRRGHSGGSQALGEGTGAAGTAADATEDLGDATDLEAAEEHDVDTTQPTAEVIADPDLYQDRPASDASRGLVLAQRYRLEETLSLAWSVQTWRAIDQVLARGVMIRLLPPLDDRSDELLETARRAASATDSRFLRVLDALPSDDDQVGAAIVNEYADGLSLAELLAQGPLSALEAAWIVREVADALSSMHAQGLHHGQLDPDQVIITRAGNIKIAGFLVIDQLRHPHTTLDEGERVEADVAALGKLLYAMLVHRWPGATGFGMAAAPTTHAGVALTPRQVRAGVSPALDRIADRILSPTPRNKQPRLESAQDIVMALTQVLGTADASGDLHRRMVDPEQVPDPEEPAVPTVADAETQVIPAVGTSAPRATATSPTTPAPQMGSGPQEGVAPQEAFAPLPVDAVPPPERNRQPRRSWLWALLTLVALVVIVSLVAALTQLNRESQTGPSPEPTPTHTAPVPREIVGAVDFDPEGDDGTENPDEVPNAIDGDPETRWRTLGYLNRSNFGGLKEGLGLVLDLGSPQLVSEVELLLSGDGTTVEIRVPADNRPDLTEPPTDSADDWTAVSESQVIGAEGTITVEPTTTRYVLVYITDLPQEDGAYRAGIHEVEVRG
ncbi:murein biosynthesis integral membrane protein MurJ [Parenemella sanctibonifatiensis]|nr:murein biosynthesis integral membrane protein MurJ [Parenemella sanctibonifatiensis]